VPGSRYYLTTAIDYSNGEPHIGHAYEKIAADVIARYHRLKGDDVWLLIGMDEHGQKVEQAAAAAGVTPQQQTDAIAVKFQAMWKRLNVSYDQFIRTTDPKHVKGVQALIERIFEQNPGDFYEKAYSGNYCVGCESFKQDAEIKDGKCVLHPTLTLEWVEEKNWFFKLSSYRERVLAHIEQHPEFLQPESRRNEILALLRGGLDDISASRSRLKWGVPFPRPTSDGDQQTMYVWFDALPNYLTGTGFPGAGFEKRWPAQLHVIGKDITRFHCVIWPAMLMAAGLPLPERVWAHGFVQLAGEKFSKSSGVKLDLGEAIDKYGADAFRYFLMREVPFDADGNFSWERFDDRYNADLANALGNLASRTIAMVEKYCDGVVPVNAKRSFEHYDAAMDGLMLHEGLANLMARAAAMNQYVDQQAPWKLAKDPAKRAELEETLATLIYVIASVARCISPFIPEKAAELWAQLGAPGRVDEPGSLGVRLEPKGWHVKKGDPLFPKPLD
jgi:methionyl-tRNA synthetase